MNVLFIIALAFFSYITPSIKWDVLGHLGSAYSIGSDDPKVIHERVYGDLKNLVGTVEYERLVGENKEREIWSTDPEAFFQTLPFYQPRLLTTYPTYIADKFGINGLLFLKIISSFYSFVGCIFLLLVAREILPDLSLVVFPLVCVISGVLEISRFPGADASAFMLSTMAIWMIINKKQFVYIVLAIMPLARSDLILFSLIISPMMWLFGFNKIKVFVTLVLSFLAYWWVNQKFGNYGWSKQFYVVGVEYLAYPATTEVKLSVVDYLRAFAQGMIQLLFNYQFLIFLTAHSLLGLKILRYIKRSLKKGQSIFSGDSVPVDFLILSTVFVAGLYVYAHFIAIPLMHTRYFVAQYAA